MMDGKNYILVVDDEPLIRFFLQDFLEENSFRVEIADTLAAAREKIKQEHPDLLLLDMRLGDGTGNELLRELRAHKHTEHLPVLLMSADSDIQQSRKAMADGANKCIIKPFDLKKLKEEVDLLLKKV